MSGQNEILHGTYGIPQGDVDKGMEFRRARFISLGEMNVREIKGRIISRYGLERLPDFENVKLTIFADGEYFQQKCLRVNFNISRAEDFK